MKTLLAWIALDLIKTLVYFMDLVWSPALKAAGAELCTKATEAEPRTEDTSEADWAPL